VACEEPHGGDARVDLVHDAAKKESPARGAFVAADRAKERGRGLMPSRLLPPTAVFVRPPHVRGGVTDSITGYCAISQI